MSIERLWQDPDPKPPEGWRPTSRDGARWALARLEGELVTSQGLNKGWVEERVRWLRGVLEVIDLPKPSTKRKTKKARA